MGAKSEHKKKYIVAKAREVFSRKGFKNVTMKDLVDACEISRGGLYLYFSSTEDVFLAVLASDAKDADEEENTNINSGDSSASEMLALFLKEQKKEILRKKDNLSLAIFEYYSSHNVNPDDNVIKNKFDASVHVIESLIADGTSSGEFECNYPSGCARNMAYVLEGLKSAASTMGVSEAAVDREMVYILQGLVPAEQYVN